LGYFPHHLSDPAKYEKQLDSVRISYEHKRAASSGLPEEIARIREDEQHALNEINILREAELQQNSYIGRIGRFIEPAMAPLGFDWKMSVAVLTGVSAKEVVVGTLGILYQANESHADNGKHSYNVCRQAGIPTERNWDFQSYTAGSTEFYAFHSDLFPLHRSDLSDQQGIRKLEMGIIYRSLYHNTCLSFITPRFPGRIIDSPYRMMQKPRTDNLNPDISIF
jgi:hypothetical protein